MLLPDNIHPENSIYYNGAFVLETLVSKKKCSILDLYQHVKVKKQMSMSIYILCLDWLFLIDAVIINSNGEIEICI